MSDKASVVGMRGDYNEHSKVQRQAIDIAAPYYAAGIAAHSGNLLPYATAPLIIADFGSSTGANSSSAMSTVIQGLRDKYGIEQTSSILAVHNDLPRNNWAELFDFVNNHEESHLKKHAGVYAVTIGSSFYQQILPDNSLHFGFSNEALHWLSKLPTKMENSCSVMLASNEEREIYRRQAADDWKLFLVGRAKELVNGGVLVIQLIGENQQERSLCIALNNATKRLVDEGLLTQRESLDFNMTITHRSMDDILDQQLFDSLGLEVEIAETAPAVESVFYRAYNNHQDKKQFAVDFRDTVLAVIEPTFMEALECGRSANQRELICSTFASHLFEEIMQTDMESLAYTSGNNFIVLKKNAYK